MAPAVCPGETTGGTPSLDPAPREPSTRSGVNAGMNIVAVLVLGLLASLYDMPKEKPIEPRTAPLAQAIDDWAALLEKDAADLAVKRWSADEKAADALREHWPRLRACHKQYDYRKWLDRSGEDGRDAGARQIADGKRFRIGGHSFGHEHVDWKKTDQGWRITGAWTCR